MEMVNGYRLKDSKGHIYFGEIVEIHCDENIMTDGKPDVLKIKSFNLKILQFTLG